jgi:transposase
VLEAADVMDTLMMERPPTQLEEILAQQHELIAQLREENARLRAENAELRGLVAQLRERVAELESKLGPPGKSAPDFVKPSRKKAKKEGPRKKRAQNFARKRDEPTQRIEHAVEECVGCGCRLLGGSVRHSRQVLHIPIVPVQVIEHLYLERECPQCGLRNAPRVDLSAEVVGRSRVSAQTMAMIATMREVERLPIRAIQAHLATFHRLSLSIGEIVNVLHLVRKMAKGLKEGILAELRASPVVHGDETSWREGGESGYLWSFSGPTLRYFEYRKSRSGEIVTELLGNDFSGVLVSDFYGGYNRMEGLHQRCWVHLLRDVHDLTEKWTGDADLEEWARGVNELYHRARDWVEAHQGAEKRERVLAQRHFERELVGLCRPYLKSDRPQRVLCERVERFLPELLAFVADPRVPSDNNAAERALRPVVISRKISGGTRTGEGSRTKDTLASIFGTWMAQGLNPFSACLSLLTTSPAL